MAACELRGELKYRDGETKPFVFKTENNVKSILSGVKKMKTEVSEVLTELVLREKGSAENGKGDLEVDDEEDEDSDKGDETEKKVSSTEPPTKRLRH